MCGTHARGFAYQNPINEDGEIGQQTHYFHCYQIGMPRTNPSDCKISLSTLACSYCQKWIEILFKKEIMGMVHFLGSPTKIMKPYNIGNRIMTTLEDKIFTLKQNNLVKKMKY